MIESNLKIYIFIWDHIPKWFFSMEADDILGFVLIFLTIKRPFKWSKHLDKLDFENISFFLPFLDSNSRFRSDLRSSVKLNSLNKRFLKHMPYLNKNI